MADMRSNILDEECKSAKPLKMKFGMSKYCQQHKLRILDVRNNNFDRISQILGKSNYLDAVVVFAWTNKRTSS